MRAKMKLTSKIIIRNILDLFDQYVPGGTVVLDHVRRARTDVASLARALRPWYSMEQKLPWLTLEVTNVCNSNCIFCAYQYQSRFRNGRGFLSDEIFDKALGEYVGMGGRFVEFTPFAGEPLLDPKIIERIETVNRLGAWTGFFTNGIRLNTIDVERLLNSGINALSVSTAPLEATMYELLYRNKHYMDVLQGLEKLLVARNRVRKDLVINISFRSHIPMREVLALSDFREHIVPYLTPEDRKNIIVNTRGLDTWGGQIKSENMVGMMRLALPPLIRRRPCAWTLSGLYVTWDGQVRACACRYAETAYRDGKDELYLGNILESTLSEIWFGEDIKRLRRSFRRGNAPTVCKKCTMYRSC